MALQLSRGVKGGVWEGAEGVWNCCQASFIALLFPAKSGTDPYSSSPIIHNLHGSACRVPGGDLDGIDTLTFLYTDPNKPAANTAVICKHLPVWMTFSYWTWAADILRIQYVSMCILLIVKMSHEVSKNYIECKECVRSSRRARKDEESNVAKFSALSCSCIARKTSSWENSEVKSSASPVLE